MSTALPRAARPRNARPRTRRAARTRPPAQPRPGARPVAQAAAAGPAAAHRRAARAVRRPARRTAHRGLAGLLFLHTALAEDSFRLHDLKSARPLLTDREQALEQEVAQEASPRRLAAGAEALGMVRSENPAFIRLSDGKDARQAQGRSRPAAPPDAVRVRRRVAEPVGQHRSVRLVEQPPAPVTTRQRPRPPAPDRRGAPARGAGAARRPAERPAPRRAASGRPVAGRRPSPPRGVPAARAYRPPPPRPPRRVRLGDSGRRLRGAVIALAFVLSLFGARLVQLQGLDAPTYAAEAEAGRLRTVTLPAVRGTITDRNGVALATTVAAVNVTADRQDGEVHHLKRAL